MAVCSDMKPNKTCAIGNTKNVKLDPLLKINPFGSLFEVDQKGILEHVGVEMLEEDEINAQIDRRRKVEQTVR